MQLTHEEPNKPLTAKQELFCRLYATDERFFSNATKSYAKAYNKDLSIPGAYQVVARSAADNLKKPHIIARINQLLEDIGFSDVEVDKQLAFLIAQHTDYKAKIAAIREYNNLKKRTTSNAPQINIIGLILKKWGLEDVGQNTGDAERISEG